MPPQKIGKCVLVLIVQLRVDEKDPVLYYREQLTPEYDFPWICTSLLSSLHYLLHARWNGHSGDTGYTKSCMRTMPISFTNLSDQCKTFNLKLSTYVDKGLSSSHRKLCAYSFAKKPTIKFFHGNFNRDAQYWDVIK